MNLVELIRGGVARHLDVAVETERREVPVGSKGFVQEMVGRYAELGALLGCERRGHWMCAAEPGMYESCRVPPRLAPQVAGNR